MLLKIISRAACAPNDWTRSMVSYPRTLLPSYHVLFLLLVTILAWWTTIARACPFCDALPHTLSDDLEESTAAVFAHPESVSTSSDGIRIYQMRVTDVLKGQPALKQTIIEFTSTRKLSSDGIFWLIGNQLDGIQWFPPTEISIEGVSYLRGLSSLPERGPQRLAYFLRFLQHDEDFIAADAYNEFAEATLEDIKGLGDQLVREWVIAQLRDTSVPLHRRRLCWTFLSQCGTAADAGLFDELIRYHRADPTFQPGMDAAIACFISLGGERALARIEREYLTKPDSDDSDAFAAISAIRVHGTEVNVIPRERLAQSLRYALASPNLADLVIPDLARWGDWSAIDRMVELFQMTTEQTPLLKPATVRYLKTCPLPEAARALEKLRAIDGNAVQLAEKSMLFNFGLASLPVPPPDTDGSNSSETGSDEPNAVDQPQHGQFRDEVSDRE